MIAELQTGKPNGDSVRSLSIDVLPTLENERFPFRSFRIVSLQKVKPYQRENWNTLNEIWFNLTDRFDFKNEPKDESELTPEQIEDYNVRLGRIEQHLEYLGLKYSLKLVAAIRERLKSTEYTYGKYKADAEVLQERVDHEAEDIIFGFIPAARADYFKNKEPFGPEVKAAFPSAYVDTRFAGVCYAHGTYTACVFHLMRALEHPLRALAVDLGVPPPPKNPQTPLELRTWGDVIGEIIKAINARPNPKTPADAEDAEFYNKAADQFQFFKDAWRDLVMHSRSKHYGEGEAKDVIVSVETFMRRLATKLKEQP
jgi:hypothetical protein